MGCCPVTGIDPETRERVAALYEEGIKPLFDQIGLPVLADEIAAGDLELPEEHWSTYSKLAALWDFPPIRLEDADSAADGLDLHRLGIELIGGNLYEIVSTGPRYFTIKGEPYLHLPDGNVVAVTVELLMHYERMLALISDEHTARTFLAACPAEHRAAADDLTATRWDDAFTAIAGTPPPEPTGK